MTRDEVNKMACAEIRSWCKLNLPDDGDFREPELVTDRINADGQGDYTVVVIFHDKTSTEDNT